MRRHLRILDFELTLSGPEECVEPIAFAYRRFAVDSPAPGAAVLALAEGAPGFVEIDGRRVSLIAELDRTAQLYQHFLDLVMARLGSHAVLHAASLIEPGGGVMLLAAPSGHGKSSLTFELVRRGFAFLGDDYAPLDLATRRVHPYPRALGLTRDAAARLGVDRMRELPTSELMGKTLVDVGDLLGEERLACGPAGLHHVVLLSDALRIGEIPRSEIRLAARAADAAELDAVFAATAGVEVAGRERRDGAGYWLLRLDPDLRPTRALSRVLESDRVLFVEKTWQARPDFAATPAIEPVSRREAAEALGRELLNRRGGGKLLERFGGSVAALFVDLAGALSQARCFRVRVGERAATAALLEELSRAASAA